MPDAQCVCAHLYHFEEGDAFHAFELPYVFGTPNPRLGAAILVEDVRREFQTAFVTFAQTGEAKPFVADENGIILEDLPPWPTYDTATDRHTAIKSPVSQGTGLSKADCDFLESIGLVQ